MYLIDGFNLIYKFPDLEELMYQHKLREARDGLLSKLKEFQSIKKTRIMVVFDGKKEPSHNTKSEKIGSIDVYYSLEYSADYLIKEFIKKDINSRMTTVVSSDKDIIFHISRFRAKSITSEKFSEYLLKTIEESKNPEIPEKDENPELSGEDISFWKNLFRSSRKKTDENNI